MEDTIAAVATAQGEGGIGIIRISGDRSKELLDQVFVPFYPDFQPGKPKQDHSRRMKYGHIKDKTSGEIIDEVLVVYMKAPSTYTTEDVVEIQCHGSIISLRKTLELILKGGARLAEKGEFTKRAFLNGRLDLSQAEAVIDMVKAKTDKGFAVAVAQLEGGLSSSVQAIRDDILKSLAHVIVNIDYPDADIEEISYQTLEQELLKTNDKIKRLLETADTGRILKEGLSTVIIGKPNVGKSSLMNALLREARAIVTEIPGTTRDTIEEILSLKDIPVKLIDTAGIRETEDVIERIGIEKTKESFNKADLVILMLNASEPLSPEDYHIIDHTKDSKTIVLLNKIDLGQVLFKEEVLTLLPEAIVLGTVISKNQGIEELETEISGLVYGGKVHQHESMLITNLRHKDLLVRAAAAMDEAIAMCSRKEALDFIEVDMRQAWEILGEIIGETVSEDIIEAVFSRFCLGK